VLLNEKGIKLKELPVALLHAPNSEFYVAMESSVKKGQILQRSRKNRPLG